MAMPWGGDELRRDMAITELQSAGLSVKAAEMLNLAGVFSRKELVEAPWSDEEAGRRFVSLQWRMSVMPGCTAKLVAHVEAVRAQLVEAQQAA